jgi:hypothetical protein
VFAVIYRTVEAQTWRIWLMLCSLLLQFSEGVFDNSVQSTVGPYLQYVWSFAQMV